MTPQSVGLSGSTLTIGKLSGRRGLQGKLHELGLDVDGEALDAVYRAAIALADVKKEVTDADLVALVEQRARGRARAPSSSSAGASARRSGGHRSGHGSLVVAGRGQAAARHRQRSRGRVVRGRRRRRRARSSAGTRCSRSTRSRPCPGARMPRDRSRCGRADRPTRVGRARRSRATGCRPTSSRRRSRRTSSRSNKLLGAEINGDRGRVRRPARRRGAAMTSRAARPRYRVAAIPGDGIGPGGGRRRVGASSRPGARSGSASTGPSS